jgi:hypothetical protein
MHASNFIQTLETHLDFKSGSFGLSANAFYRQVFTGGVV